MRSAQTGGRVPTRRPTGGLTVLLLALAAQACGGNGCGGASDTPPAPSAPLPRNAAGQALPSPEGPAVNLPPLGSGDVLYEFIVRTAEDRFAGTRVFTDGRVEVTTGAPARPKGDADTEPPLSREEAARRAAPEAGDAAWRHDRVLSPAQLQALTEALSAEAVRNLPATLKGDPAAPGRGPRATWRLRVDGRLKLVEAAHYSGVRVPALESLHRLLIPEGTDAGGLTTDWVVQREGHTLTASVPCHPGQTVALRAITHLLLDPKAPTTEVAGDAPPPASPERLSITWKEASLAWVTRLFDDGTVLRGRPNGTAVRAQLTPEQLTTLRAALDSVDLANGKELCKRRLLPGASTAEPGSLKGPLPPGARVAPKGAEPPPVASPDEAPATP